MLERLRRWLLRNGAATILSFVIETEPVPASRPRVPCRGKPYYLRGYRNWREDADGLLKGAAPAPVDGPVIILADHVAPKPKSRKKTYPRGDVDNFAKATLDAITSADVLNDDDQVVLLVAQKRYSGEDEDPHTSISIHHVPTA